MSAFRVKGADGQPVVVPDGEWYMNAKARGRRMMLNSLSSDARRVYACLELATMGYSQELAVIMDGGEQRPLTPTDISRQTELKKQEVRRGLAELEQSGLAQRVGDDGKGLRNGHILIYSWAVPRSTGIEKKVGERAYLLPKWFPESCEGLKPFLSHYKIKLSDDFVVARAYLSELESLAREYKLFTDRAARTLERVCAPGKRPPPSLYERNGNSNPPHQGGVRAKKKADEDEDVPWSSTLPARELYSSFKELYPRKRFDEAKARGRFRVLSAIEQARAIEQLGRYLICDRWNSAAGRYIPFASNWLKSYDADPPPAFHASNGQDRMQADMDTTMRAVRYLEEAKGGRR